MTGNTLQAQGAKEEIDSDNPANLFWQAGHHSHSFCDANSSVMTDQRGKSVVISCIYNSTVTAVDFFRQMRGDRPVLNTSQPAPAQSSYRHQVLLPGSKRLLTAFMLSA
jgi:hypothetical protein